MRRESHTVEVHGATPHADTIRFVGSEIAIEGQVVTGAPFSAEGVTESTRTLADGTRITCRSTAAIYRDSQGRTRREQAIHMIGPWAAAEAPKTVIINDPVAKETYILNPAERSARRIKMFDAPLPHTTPHRPSGEIVRKEVRVVAHASVHEGSKTEPLGKQMVEGVLAEGTRTTTTIPAGQIGNDRPITIVAERWYSPELQTVVLRKLTDPLAEDSSYRLTNIRRAEPPAHLFQLPPDYTVTEDEAIVHKVVVEKELPKK